MFNFWPFNVARKRRERQEAEAAEREAVAVAAWPTIKRNKVIPMSDPRHPRNLSPQQRADRIAAMRPELGMAYHGSRSGPVHSIPTHDNLPKVIGVDYASGPDQTVVQQFRCDHPAISEFWQQQQERCDSPTDTSSPSCDAPSTDN